MRRGNEEARIEEVLRGWKGELEWEKGRMGEWARSLASFRQKECAGRGGNGEIEALVGFLKERGGFVLILQFLGARMARGEVLRGLLLGTKLEDERSRIDERADRARMVGSGGRRTWNAPLF